MLRIAPLKPDEHAEFLAIVNAEIRPGRATTHAWEDFPLILGRDNLAWQLGAWTPEGRLAGGIACLIRDFETSCGVVPVAGIGSVVTRPEFRGRGLSRTLQIELLELLHRQEIPLGVLWSDKPEIYAGRGFLPAGWELHVELPASGLDIALPAEFILRDFQTSDAAAAAALYGMHPLRTLRRENDAGRLYTMPGTRGVVGCAADGKVLATVFCGKGADFPDYVTEWAGRVDLVLGLLAFVQARGWASRVLVCAGGEHLLEPLVRRGAGWFAQASGLWKVIRPEILTSICRGHGKPPPGDIESPVAWLGDVDPRGRPRRGALDLAVWGFDSV